MKKQIILHIIKTTVEIEALFLLIFLLAYSVTHDYSGFWRSFLIFQILAVCIIIISTLEFHVSYSNEIDDLRLQEKLNEIDEIKKEMKTNKELMVCLEKFKKENCETMKYIRTEDGIYKAVKEEILCGVKFYDYETREDSINRIREEQIIEEANTIEELCDWFFLEGANGNPINYKKFHTAKRAKERIQLEFDLYGVIHVKGKGLIYVAKMNSKGELELL